MIGTFLFFWGGGGGFEMRLFGKAKVGTEAFKNVCHERYSSVPWKILKCATKDTQACRKYTQVCHEYLSGTPALFPVVGRIGRVIPRRADQLITPNCLVPISRLALNKNHEINLVGGLTGWLISKLYI